jgi:acetylornithine deacetylase
VDAVALPRLRRFVGEAEIQTLMEVDVPGLAAVSESAAATLALRLTGSNQTLAVSYATEAGHFQRAGLPTVVCGPGSIDQAHKPDEFLSTEQLADCLAFLGRLAREAAG